MFQSSHLPIAVSGFTPLWHLKRILDTLYSLYSILRPKANALGWEYIYDRSVQVISCELCRTRFQIQSQNENRSIQVVKWLPAYLSAAMCSSVFKVLTPENLHDHNEFQLSHVEPTGSWHPLRQLLFAGYNGVFLGYMEFNPVWTDEFDSFVLVVRFDKVQVQYPWQFTLVSGDNWKSQKAHFRKEYFFASPMLNQHKVILHHLYDRTREKTVSLRLSSSRGISPSQQS